jgi:hypothetical protein
MANFIIKVDGLTDAQLSFFGWIMVDRGDEFSLYWNPRYNEEQPVSNDPPRYLVLDDWNDAQHMATVGGAPITKGPNRHN